MKTLTDEDGSHDIYIADMHQIHNGITQNNANATPLLSGSGLYIHLMARVRLYNPITGDGV